MSSFSRLMKPYDGMSVLDLGGQPGIWDYVDATLNITCLNLPGVAELSHRTHHNIRYVEGDACKTDFMPGDFDLIFSNSVIEHVGDKTKREMFAAEILRVCKRYWVQTPCKYFPIEAHNGMPLWWFYPEWLKQWFISHWREKLPSWTEMIEGTTVLEYREMRELFPNGRLKYEWFVVPKSIVAYSLGD